MILDIGVGKKPLGDINVDVVPNPMCDILGDIQYLPFRDTAISKVICKAVLEHVDDPRLAISEIKRILIEKGVAEIGVPKESFTNNSWYYLMFFVLNFPITILPKFVRSLSKKIKQINNRDVALFHKFKVPGRFIEEYFHIEKVVEYGDILYSFLNYGKKSRYFRNKPRINTAFLFVCRKVD